MKKLNRKELINHFYEIEKKIDKIYFILLENKEFSTIKLNLYASQLELLNLETKKTLDALREISVKAIIKLILMAIIDIGLSLLAIICFFSNLALGLLLMLLCSCLNLIAISTFKKKSDGIFWDDMIRIRNTTLNCQMLLTRHLNSYQSLIKQSRLDDSKEYIATKANAIILYYLDNLNLEVNDDMLESKVRDEMIIMLQNELKTEEKSLAKLIAMARQINQENPFNLEEEQDVLVLSRKNKKR